MQTENLKTIPEIVLWKQLGITSCTMEFSCGGDSMNDYSFTFFKPNEKKGKNQPAVVEVECPELWNYFDNEVFRNVEFYEASDGHYQGESGSVEITLEEDEEESTFVYSKSSQSEWSERTTNVIGITLTKNEIDFINNYVLNINGGDNDVVVNFKKDFIMTDDDEELLTDLKDRVDKETRDYTPEEIDGELDDWYSFTTNGDEQDEITIDENGSLQVEVSNSYTSYRDDDNF
jgi:hypothetical protein